MCGIFGIIANEKSNLEISELKNIVNKLFKLSESRGKEAAGLAFLYKDNIDVLKVPVMASELINSAEYKKLFESNFNGNKKLDGTVAIIGHSRLVTNGTEDIHGNNQPVLRDGMACIHNGIIVNDKELWAKFPSMKRYYDVDTEIILALVSKFRNENQSLESAVRNAFEQIYGATSIAVMLDNSDELILATNNGSLYICCNKKMDLLVFASERYILDELLDETKLKSLNGELSVSNVLPGTFYLCNLKNLSLNKFSIKENNSSSNGSSCETKSGKKNINEIKPGKDYSEFLSEIIPKFPAYNPSTAETLLKVDTKAIDSLKRCAKCILPETFPFIEFDEKGVCNVCRNYKKLEFRGKDELEKLISPYRSKDGTPDCLMAFSGGRDSSYAIHYVKNEMKMNPLAYTYDWGMVTDIARRNISRLCGKLGIEHILLSADIRTKRKNIRKNVLAWLKRPSLGTIPLFMAGDKQFFYFANKLQKQMNLKLLIFSMNPLERTDFKVGFCNIDELSSKNSQKHYKLSQINKLKLISYYGKEYLLNPAYLNSTVWDTLFGYFSYYMIPQNYLTLYDFIKWDEEVVNKTLIGKYDWEVASDTKSTWRIGDGTASFYNYIYYKVAGFTEFDTFRSNQIREGFITREEAIKNINANNHPRGESIKWYCDTIGIDFESTIKRINQIPTLY